MYMQVLVSGELKMGRAEILPMKLDVVLVNCHDVDVY